MRSLVDIFPIAGTLLQLEPEGIGPLILEYLISASPGQQCIATTLFRKASAASYLLMQE